VYADDCIETVFQQGLAKLKASNGEIPRVFYISPISMEDNGFVFENKNIAMNNAFAEWIASKGKVAFIAPPVRTNIDYMRGAVPPTFDTVSTLHSFVASQKTGSPERIQVNIEAINEPSSGDGKKSIMEQYAVPGANGIVLLAFGPNYTEMASRNVNLSEAYIFGSFNTFI